MGESRGLWTGPVIQLRIIGFAAWNVCIGPVIQKGIGGFLA